MKNDIVICTPEDGKIYHLETGASDKGSVWIFRYCLYNKPFATLTGCNYCLRIDNEGRIAYRDKLHGYIGNDSDVEVLKPANENEIAIFNRVFGL